MKKMKSKGIGHRSGENYKLKMPAEADPNRPNGAFECNEWVHTRGLIMEQNEYDVSPEDFVDVYADYFKEASKNKLFSETKKNSEVVDRKVVKAKRRGKQTLAHKQIAAKKTQEQKKKVQNDVFDQLLDQFVGSFGDVDLKG